MSFLFVFLYFSDVPKLSLSLGSNIVQDQVYEYKDVTFECHVQANPPVNGVTWQMNGRPLSATATITSDSNSNQPHQRIVMINSTLILYNVTRHQSGDYRCLAANSEGEGVSSEMQLRVLCE